MIGNPMNSPLPMNNGGAGTLVLGDITIVQNHNFGMGNPQMQMQMMQQQMALQQQQSNMMLLGAVSAFAKLAKDNNMKFINSGRLDDSVEELPNQPRLRIAEQVEPEKEKKPFVVETDAQDVEYEIKNVDEGEPEIQTTVVGKHMCKFFRNGELKDDIQFNRFYKVEEDTRTFVIFIKKNTHNPAAWRKTFREAYKSHQNKIIKGAIDEQISKQDAIYIAILFSTQGGKPDIIFIDKKENGRDSQISDEMMKEYTDGVAVAFGNIYRLCEPYIPESDSIVNYHDIQHPCCHVRDTLFSNALYLTSDM